MNENDFPKFWMVLSGDFGAAPTFRHGSEHRAREEAVRLASENPGVKFYVLECIAACVKADVQWAVAKDMPF